MVSIESFPPVNQWVQSYKFSPIEIDCITTVMLKILDGKCKMFPEEKHVMTIIYDTTKTQDGIFLGNDIHHLIDTARLYLSEELKTKIYEQRLYAETMISRPVMKSFKAMLREHGIIGNIN